MCGIAGFVRRDGELATSNDVHRMCESIVHRGPDDEGIYVHGPTSLGIRRLSIIDLKGGHQPIRNEDGSVWVVLNGEIYNYEQLREELRDLGHHFYTRSDTEVIVHLYEEFGAECVKKLRGMFAIALYDCNRRALLLVRDRLGKKPLYYALHRGQILFGSEIKALLAVAPELAEIDAHGIQQYFYFGYIPEPRSAFLPIRKLPPGCLLEYRNNQATVNSYWDLPAYGTCDPGSEEECLEELERRLDDAVRIRLLSEVPLGALLSGGVDSSVVVALMARHSSQVKTFSVAFGHEDFNEIEHAQTVAQRFSTEHHEFVVKPDIAETLTILTGKMEEPFGDSSMVPTYHVSRLARQFVTVVLSGDGGDELFAGYDRYQVYLDRQKFPTPPDWMGRGFREWIYPLLPWGTWGRRLAFNISLNAGDRFIDSVSYLPAGGRERRLFSQDFLNWVGSDSNPVETYQNYFNQAPASDLLGKLLYVDTKTYLPADILTKVDRMSMLNSLEGRCPLLDHVVVEWTAALASRWKLRDGRRKYLLRRLAQKLGIPAQVLDRPKKGFSMPLQHWWRSELKDDLLGILLEPRTLQRGYFDPKAVRTLVNEHLSGRRNHPTAIWLLLIFELWHRNFLFAAGRESGSGDESVLAGIAGKGCPWEE